MNASEKREIIERVAETLEAEHPGPAEELCELEFASAWQLLVMTVLAAQSTDVRVNQVAPELFATYPSPEALADAVLEDVEKLIFSTGFYRNKAKAIVGLSQDLVAHHESEVPADIDDLVKLPGVGRKTANVVRATAMGLPGFAVDTHVTRVLNRLAIVDTKDAVKIEREFCELWPCEAKWGGLSLRLVLHGRYVCLARKPKCGECSILSWCEYGKTQG